RRVALCRARAHAARRRDAAYRAARPLVGRGACRLPRGARRGKVTLRKLRVQRRRTGDQNQGMSGRCVPTGARRNDMAIEMTRDVDRLRGEIDDMRKDLKTLTRAMR